MYAVILFTERDEVEVVPRSWVNNKKCWWPPLKGTSLKKAIEQRAPAQVGWASYDARVLAVTESYEKARAKCKKAVELHTSELATTDENEKRRHHPAQHRYQSDADESEPEDSTRKGHPRGTQDPHDSEGFEEARHVMKKKKSVQNMNRATLPELPDFPIASIPDSPGISGGPMQPNQPVTSGPSTYNPSRPSTSSSSDPNQFISTTPSRQSTNDRNEGPFQSEALLLTTPSRDKMLFTLLEEIKGHVRKNTLLLQSLLNRQQVECATEESLDISLPLATEADVERVEELLHEKPKFRSLVRHLCSLGGIGAKDVIHRIMSAMFTNALAAQYNWYGKGQKIGLAMMELAKVIKDAAKRVNIKEADAELAVKKWLKYAADRDGGRKKRAEKQRLKAQESMTLARDLQLSDSE